MHVQHVRARTTKHACTTARPWHTPRQRSSHYRHQRPQHEALWPGRFFFLSLVPPWIDPDFPLPERAELERRSRQPVCFRTAHHNTLAVVNPPRQEHLRMQSCNRLKCTCKHMHDQPGMPRNSNSVHHWPFNRQRSNTKLWRKAANQCRCLLVAKDSMLVDSTRVHIAVDRTAK